MIELNYSEKKISVLVILNIKFTNDFIPIENDYFDNYKWTQIWQNTSFYKFNVESQK